MGDLIQFRPRAMPMSKPVNEKADEWDSIRGIAPDATGDLSSEEFIRKMRDEWYSDDLTMSHADPEVEWPDSGDCA